MQERVFRLITFFFSTACLAALVWFGLTVDLGDRTLFGHIRAIGGSEEAQELGKGIKSKVDDFVGIEAAKRAAEEAARKRQPGTVAAGPPQDEYTAADREGLRKLAGSKRPSSRPEASKSGKPQGRATPPSARPPAPVDK